MRGLSEVVVTMEVEVVVGCCVDTCQLTAFDFHTGPTLSYEDEMFEQSTE